jgi:hypothetical protein
MKWINKTKTLAIDTTKITSWELLPGPELKITIDGTQKLIRGNDAKDLYDYLLNERQLL